MAAQSLDSWANPYSETGRLEEMRGSCIGFEADYFLSHLDELVVPSINRPINEALLPALGGLPFGLKDAIRRIMAVLRDYSIKPIFVFNGINIDDRDNKDSVFHTQSRSASELQRAWGLYERGDNQHTVDIFKNSGAVTPKYLHRFFQTILREEGVEFLVAPYDALPQLAYLYSDKYIDSIYSSPELLLYDVPDVVTQLNLTAAEFTFIRRQVCYSDLGTTPDIFVDALLLSGASRLPTFPLLESNRAPAKIKAAYDMIMNSPAKSGHSLCLQYEDHPDMKKSNYLDRFRRIRLAVKHHVVLRTHGKAEPLVIEEAPGDVHEFISNRLNDELYMYLTRGIISPRMLNWITRLEIIEQRPFDNGDSEDYRSLIKDKLLPSRSAALAVLCTTMHRFYQHRRVILRTWYEDPTDQEIAIDQVDIKPAPLLARWNCHEDIYGLEKNKYLVRSPCLPNLKILTALG
jgi:hypothetical protein